MIFFSMLHEKKPDTATKKWFFILKQNVQLNKNMEIFLFFKNLIDIL